MVIDSHNPAPECGDIVQLNSGGPRLTVLSINLTSTPPTVRVVGLTDTQSINTVVPLACLTKAK